MRIQPLKIAFLDVGHGDSIVIILPESEPKGAIVIDTPDCIATKRFLDDNAIQVLEKVVITHSHLDHSKGIVPLIEKYKSEGKEVKNLIYAYDRSVDSSKRKIYRMLMERLVEISDNGIPAISPVIDGAEKVIYENKQANLRISILYPDNNDLTDAFNRGNCNDTSIVIAVEYNNFKVLLPGDLEAKGWYRLNKRITLLNGNKTWDVLKLPHHGDYYDAKDEEMSTEQILDFVKPKFGIISSAQNDEYQHPDANTICKLREKNVDIYCTQATGICYGDKERLKETVELEELLFSKTYIDLEKSKGVACSGNIIISISDHIKIGPSVCYKDLFEFSKCV